MKLLEGGGSSVAYKTELMTPIINKNRFNQEPKIYMDEKSKTVDPLTGSYISLIEEESFLLDPDKYIENAFGKSENTVGYNISKTI